MLSRDDLKRQYQTAFQDMRRHAWRTGEEYYAARKRMTALRIAATARGIRYQERLQWEIEAMQEARDGL